MMIEWLTDLFGRLIEAAKGGLRAFVGRYHAEGLPPDLPPDLVPDLPEDWRDRVAGAVALIEAALSILDEVVTDTEKLAEAVADAIASAIRRAKNRATQDAPPRLAAAAASPGKRTYSPATMRRHTAVTGD